MPQSGKDPVDGKLRSFVDGTYSPVPKDDPERLMDSIISLVEAASDKKRSLKSVLDQFTKLIFKHFEFSEISIGLRSLKDRAYRYESLFGYRKDLEDKYRMIVYTQDDMVSSEIYPRVKMGRLAYLIVAEGMSEKERDLLTWPHQLAKKRVSPEMFHEGDYLDIWMLGQNKELIGWIELSSPVMTRMPSRSDVRWLELIASVMGPLLQRKQAEED